MTKVIKLKQSDITKLVDNIVNEQMLKNNDDNSEVDTLAADDLDSDEPENVDVDKPESGEKTDIANNEFLIAKDKEGFIYMIGPDGEVLMKVK